MYRRIAAAVSASALMVALAASGASAQPASDQPVNSWGVMANGVAVSWAQLDTMFPQAVDGASTSEPASDTMSPMLMDPVDEIACNVLNDTAHEIYPYDNVPAFAGFTGGKVSLTCGNANYGYRHIRDRHEADWANVVHKYHQEPGAWDDLMNWSNLNSLLNPIDRVVQANNKLCYTTPIVFLDADMNPIGKMNPQVIISADNRWIITSIPGGGC